jgi:hypothetical protein
MRKRYAKQKASRKSKRQSKVTGQMTVTDNGTRYKVQRLAVDVGDLYDPKRQLPNGWRSCVELGNHYKAAKQAARYMRSK